MGLDDNLRRVPPQSLDAEQSVLGGILLDNTAIDRVIELLSSEDFYREAHRKVFRAAVSLSERNEPIDLVTLSEVLRARGELEGVGGATYLAQLADCVPTAANIVNYARIVRDKSILRALISATTEIATRGYEAPDDVTDLLDQAEQRIFAISDREVKPAFVRIENVLTDTIKLIERLYEQKQSVTGVTTGYADLDRITAGFQPSDLIIIAGRPSMGKTAFVLNIAAQCRHEGRRGGRGLLARDGEGAAGHAPPLFRGSRRPGPGAYRPPLRSRVPTARDGGGPARRHANLHRRHAGALRPGASRESTAVEARPEPPSSASSSSTTCS